MKKLEIIKKFTTMNKKQRNDYLEKRMRLINSEQNEEKRNKLNSLLIDLREIDAKKSKEEEDEENELEVEGDAPAESNKKEDSNEVDNSDVAIDLSNEGEEKDGGPDATKIYKTIQTLMQTQLPPYAEGKGNEYYRIFYIDAHASEMDSMTEEHKSDDASVGGKTQKKKNKRGQSRAKQRTIKNKVRY